MLQYHVINIICSSHLFHSWSEYGVTDSFEEGLQGQWKAEEGFHACGSR